MCTCVFKEWCISFTVLRVHHLLDPSRTETLRWIPVLGGPVIRVTINYCEHTVLLFANSMFQIHCQVKRFFWILPVCRHEISEFQTVIIILLHDEVCRSLRPQKSSIWILTLNVWSSPIWLLPLTFWKFDFHQEPRCNWYAFGSQLFGIKFIPLDCTSRDFICLSV
jgi:hypothetical protein